MPWLAPCHRRRRLAHVDGADVQPARGRCPVARVETDAGRWVRRARARTMGPGALPCSHVYAALMLCIDCVDAVFMPCMFCVRTVVYCV